MHNLVQRSIAMPVTSAAPGTKQSAITTAGCECGWSGCSHKMAAPKPRDQKRRIDDAIHSTATLPQSFQSFPASASASDVCGYGYRICTSNKHAQYAVPYCGRGYRHT
jgi:hypothetical protein